MRRLPSLLRLRLRLRLRPGGRLLAVVPARSSKISTSRTYLPRLFGLFWPGLRPSHLQLLLRLLCANGNAQRTHGKELKDPEEFRRCWAVTLERCGPRLKPSQVLPAVEAAAQLRISVAGFLPLLRKAQLQTRRLVRILELLREEGWERASSNESS